MKKNRLNLILMGLLFFCLTAAGGIAGEENRGSENLLLDSGRMNPVHFPHYRHQEVLDDCRVCHDLFPKEVGSIKLLKDQGKLKKQEVMKKHCIVCHRKMKSEGKKTGPLTCGRCHHK